MPKHGGRRPGAGRKPNPYPTRIIKVQATADEVATIRRRHGTRERTIKLLEEVYFLWCDNGSGWFDCASPHTTLDAAIEAAKTGWQSRQHITTDKFGDNIVWLNY